MVRIGLVATFARWKGHARFSTRSRRLPESLPVRGYVIGGPVYETAGSQVSLDELRAAVAALGLEGRVGFTGFVEDAAQAMRALDVVVHASTEPEPFGLVIAEAMACARAGGGEPRRRRRRDHDARTWMPWRTLRRRRASWPSASSRWP